MALVMKKADDKGTWEESEFNYFMTGTFFLKVGENDSSKYKYYYFI